MKRKILENSGHAVSLQNRISKYQYLSKDDAPGAADTLIFNLIQSTQQRPNKEAYPNLYHWYIIIKQFSSSTRQKWLNKPLQQDDQMIQSILNYYNDKNPRKYSLLESKQNILTPSLLRSSSRTEKRCSEIRHDRTQVLLYALNICFKQDISTKILEIITNLQSAEIQIEDYELSTSNSLFIIFASTQITCQKLKDYISNWKTIETFFIKQKKKTIQRSKTFENKMLKERTVKHLHQNSMKI